MRQLLAIRSAVRVALGLGLAALLASACDSETGCKNDFDCPAATVCRVTSGQCETFSCKVDADCESGQVCSDNRCLQP